MLTVLEKMDSKEAANLLARSVLILTPESKPALSIHEPIEAVKPEEVKQLTKNLLNESKQRLGIELDDESNLSKNRVLQFLSEELSKVVLEGKNENEIRNRLAERDILQPAKYKIRFANEAEDVIERRPISKRQICDVVKNPDAYEIFLRGDEYLPPGKHFALFVKTFGRNIENRYSLMIEVGCEAVTRTIYRIWKIYHSDIESASKERPLDLLRCFAETFGLEFRLSKENPWRKLVVSEALQLHSPIQNPNDVFNLLSFKHPLKTPCEGGGFFRQNTLNVLIIAFFYVIDSQKYDKALRSHGDTVKPRTKKLGIP